jgi:ABC-type dipeptide/oligopeptide/nickel transport system ATPase subunit
MSNSALQKLTIAHLRGSVTPFTLQFEKGKKLTIVYGENASGKTTICDAFEFLARGRVGSLENRGLGKTSRYWHSVGKSASDIVVTLEAAGSACVAKLSKGEVVALPSANRPKVQILRRTHMQQLIDGQPRDRYALIDPFVDVSGVTASESTLRELIRSLNSRRDTAVAVVQENETAIRQFWEAANKPGQDPIKWAELEAARDSSALQIEQQALSNLRSAYYRLTDYPEKVSTANSTLDDARTRAAAAAAKLETVLATAAEGVGELVGILEAAKSYLQKHPHPEQCPLCQSTEKVAGLGDRVDSRLNEFSAVQKAKREKDHADKTVQEAERRLTDLKVDLARDSQAFESAKAAHQWKDNVQMPKDPCPSGLEALADWLKSTSQLAAHWQQAESALQSQSRFIQTLKQAVKNYRENVQAQKELDRLLPRLELALEIVEDERKKFTDGVLQAIATRVGTLYEAVHPGEGLNKITLELDPNRRASLDIGASFGGQTGTPPQAYFSQSHLDTLGLCIFLALAAMDKPEEVTLVLDDILASVDEPHVERLIEMLYSEVIKFRHCIVTTHYRPWKEKLRWGWLQNGQCHFVELTKWTAASGLQLIQSLPDVERLRKLLAEAPPDPQLVCSKAGVILEAALDFLTQLYECSIPRRLGARYTLGDLLSALNRKLRTALVVEVLATPSTAGAATYNTVALAPMLDELTRIAQVRNVMGAHFNALSFALLDADAMGFGQQVLLLMDALVDPNAGWPKSAKSGSYWATAGETRRLHPLQQPA